MVSSNVFLLLFIFFVQSTVLFSPTMTQVLKMIQASRLARKAITQNKFRPLTKLNPGTVSRAKTKGPNSNRNRKIMVTLAGRENKTSFNGRPERFLERPKKYSVVESRKTKEELLR